MAFSSRCRWKYCISVYRSQKRKRQRSQMEEVSGLRRIYSCSLFVYFNPWLEDWKWNKKKNSFKKKKICCWPRQAKRNAKFVCLSYMEFKFLYGVHLKYIEQFFWVCVAVECSKSQEENKIRYLLLSEVWWVSETCSSSAGKLHVKNFLPLVTVPSARLGS